MEPLVGINERASSSSSGHLQKGGLVALTPELDVKDVGASLRFEIVNTRAKDLQRKIDQDLAGIGLLPAVLTAVGMNLHEAIIMPGMFAVGSIKVAEVRRNPALGDVLYVEAPGHTSRS